jgi:hypothetical protein
MGHMLKNTVFRSGSYALGVPQGTSSVGPATPVNGQTRFNRDTGKLEFWANIAGTPSWNSVSREGNVALVKDSFVGDGANTNFGPLTSGYNSGQEAQILVHVGTVYQIPGTNYTFSGTGNTTIQFTSIPNNGAAITIIHGLASTVSTLA